MDILYYLPWSDALYAPDTIRNETTGHACDHIAEIPRTHTKRLLGSRFLDSSVGKSMYTARSTAMMNSLYHIETITVSPGPTVLSSAPRKNLVASSVSALKHVAVSMSAAPHSSLQESVRETRAVEVLVTHTEPVMTLATG